jgi:putative methyltransferase (TIGR04325 family)
VEYTWPLLAHLLFVLAKQGKLDIVDYGGSLGCTYRQNLRYLELFENIRWNIIEQSHFVRAGNAEFRNEHLRFYFTLDECFKNTSPNVLLLGSVIQYMENPYDFLSSIMENRFEYIIIDRTTFSRDGGHYICVQILPDYLYDASYPCHLLSKPTLYDVMASYYQLVEEYDVETDKEDNSQPFILGSLWRRI